MEGDSVWINESFLTFLVMLGNSFQILQNHFCGTITYNGYLYLRGLVLINNGENLILAKFSTIIQSYNSNIHLTVLLGLVTSTNYSLQVTGYFFTRCFTDWATKPGKHNV